jgi:uncharacterized protein
MKDFHIGSPIAPEDLWFREEFIAELWSVLNVDHVVLTAPRRTGKTTVMDHMAEYPQNSFSCVSVFVQDLDHPAEFLLTILDAFHDKYPNHSKKLYEDAKGILKQIRNQIAEVEFASFKVGFRETHLDFREQWKSMGDEFFEQIRNKQIKVLFIVDEFPDLIVNMQKKFPELVRPFLAWYRGHCVKPQPRKDPIRWLLGGSVNLSSTLDAINCLDLINAFNTIDLPVLTHQQTMCFVNTMLSDRQVDFDEDIPAAVSERLGRPVPLFMQMVTQDLYRFWNRSNRKLLVTDVDQVFADLVLSSTARDKLQHFYSRIEMYYTEPSRSAAYALLVKLCVSQHGVEKHRLKQEFLRILLAHGIARPQFDSDRLFNQLMRDLENDFYVIEVQDKMYDFASGVLKAWWRKYYA